MKTCLDTQSHVKARPETMMEEIGTDIHAKLDTLWSRAGFAVDGMAICVAAWECVVRRVGTPQNDHQTRLSAVPAIGSRRLRTVDSEGSSDGWKNIIEAQ